MTGVDPANREETDHVLPFPTSPPAEAVMSISRRFLAIGVIAAALGIPLFVIYMLVWDRSATAAQARSEISAGWAGEQTLRGPWLVVPFTERRLTAVEAAPAEAATGTVTGAVAGVGAGAVQQVLADHQDALVIAPDDLHVTARLAPELRRRSLFETVVYQADLAVEARFSTGAIAGGDVDPARLDWARAYYVLAIDDPRGFGGSIPHMRIDGRLVEAEPGSRDLKLPGGAISAPAGLSAPPAGPIRLSSRLPVKGSTGFGVDGHARRMTVDLASPWPHPSFTGGLLPDRRSISAKGFAARWSTSYLVANRPLAMRASTGAAREQGAPGLAEVRLIQPADLYAQVERSLKYGILFIALTFLTFFAYDVTGRRRVPMLAYALVGLGLVLFFLLLLALAEYISLTPAYVLAAAALIGLIGSYSKAVLGGTGRALVIGGVLTLLYGVLYVLLQLEDYALLLGSLILFAALGVLMYVTRHVGEGEAEAEAREDGASDADGTPAALG
ncbi:hypothetical protein CMV14_08780 [Rhizorhabdus dicambivorans]|nr:hypothetical protein CMV14_08780 [Rhizorhabdus dicambivorans]